MQYHHFIISGQEGGRGDEKRKEEKEGKDEVGRTEGRREMRQSTSDGGLYLGRKRSEEEGEWFIMFW